MEGLRREELRVSTRYEKGRRDGERAAFVFLKRRGGKKMGRKSPIH